MDILWDDTSVEWISCGTSTFQTSKCGVGVRRRVVATIDLPKKLIVKHCHSHHSGSVPERREEEKEKARQHSVDEEDIELGDLFLN